MQLRWITSPFTGRKQTHFPGEFARGASSCRIVVQRGSRENATVRLPLPAHADQTEWNPIAKLVMKHVLLTASLAVAHCMGLIGVAAAEESLGVERSISPMQALTCPSALLRGCRDIYCPKPLPCISRFCHGCGKDDYCGKPIPCVPCYRGCCRPECYFRKPGPDLCRPLAAEYYTCEAGTAGCRESGTDTENATRPLPDMPRSLSAERDQPKPDRTFPGPDTQFRDGNR